MIELRQYQQEAISAIKKAHAAGDHAAGVLLPTGTGKTVIMAGLLHSVLHNNARAIIIAPSDVLVENAVGTLTIFFDPSEVGVVKAERNDVDARIVVASIQTILNEQRLEPLRNKFDWVIADEMDQYLAPVWRKSLEALPKQDGMLVGFSATVERADGVGLSHVFGELVYHKTLAEMIQTGWLCNLTGVRIDAEVDFSDATLCRGNDFNDEELERVMNTSRCHELLFNGWKQCAADRITVGFTPTVKMAAELADYWKAQGISADYISGSMSKVDTENCLERFTTGQTQVLFSCMKIAIGFDHKPINAVYIIRPTKSRRLYAQQVGRGTRICDDSVYTELTKPLVHVITPTKTDCLILDAGGVSDLGLIQLPDLFDLPDDTIEKIKKQRVTDPTPVDFKSHAPKIEATGLSVTAVNLFDTSKYAWVRTAFGWLLYLGNNCSIRLDRVGSGFIVTAHSKKEKIPIQRYPIGLDLAMGIAETWSKTFLKGKSKSIATKNAKWRERDITEKQFYILKRMKVMFNEWNEYIDYIARAPVIMTAGEASDILARTFSRK